MASRTTGLTPKQRHFCRSVVSGCTMSDAYRQAYNTGNMKPATVNREAHTLMADPKIATRVESLQKAKDRAVVASAISDRERVLDKLRHFMEHAEPSDGAKIRAAELVGKSIGLFKDVTVTEEPVRTVEELREKLERKLVALGVVH